MSEEGSESGIHLQETLFLRAKRQQRPVTIYLVSGVRLTGRVRGYDRFTILLDAKDQEQLIYKHAISTVNFAKGGEPRRPEAHRGGADDKVEGGD